MFSIFCKLLIVLLEQILAIVIPVRRSHHRMNMAASGDFSLSIQRDRALMVELYKDDWTLDSVIEDNIRINLSFPSKIGFI